MNGLAEWLKPWALALVGHFPTLRVTSVYRSSATQARLWRNRARNPYPVLPPGSSMHQYRRAWDMVGDEKELARAGATWQSWGGRWSASDPIHFEA